MAEVTQEQVVDYIKGISVLELSRLVKTLEEELGVSAAAAMPVAAAGAAARGQRWRQRRSRRSIRSAQANSSRTTPMMTMMSAMVSAAL